MGGLQHFHFILIYERTEVHKGDKMELVEKYTPISLLPTPAKCLERIVDDAICDHILPYLY